jgi:hypothetical protein
MLTPAELNGFLQFPKTESCSLWVMKCGIGGYLQRDTAAGILILNFRSNYYFSASIGNGVCLKPPVVLSG